MPSTAATPSPAVRRSDARYPRGNVRCPAESVTALDDPPAGFDGGHHRGQQRRFARAVPAGDFALPVIGLQQFDELRESLAMLEDKVDRARPQPRGGERVGRVGVGLMRHGGL